MESLQSLFNVDLERYVVIAKIIQNAIITAETMKDAAAEVETHFPFWTRNEVFVAGYHLGRLIAESVEDRPVILLIPESMRPKDGKIVPDDSPEDHNVPVDRKDLSDIITGS